MIVIYSTSIYFSTIAYNDNDMPTVVNIPLNNDTKYDDETQSNA